ncbi:hypothetical protein ILUMI_10996 [Ignelater luminosus]|uniref:TTF-type domain-containing protein n=1 Tax=Ignelater luminosus TaxID=2038154 RepID=A0A8K0CWS9_IGNLU|nr:hypothetical protein ILUMI_10996 [Ignelater luminosus]
MQTPAGSSFAYERLYVDEEAGKDVRDVNVIPNAINQYDIELLKFNNITVKAILDESLRVEIIQLGSPQSQNIEEPFLPTNSRSMNKSWFKRTLANGLGEEVTRSWLVYSSSKKSAFCMCCLLFSRSYYQSSLEQENGLNQSKAPERMVTDEHLKNHRDSFTESKETERIFSEKKRNYKCENAIGN